MPQHVVDLPRLQRLHEGQGPARRALHHQPHLRHLRRQPRHLLGATRRTWRTACSRRTSPSGSINLGEAAEYMFDHNLFQDNLVGVDFCEQMVKETNPGVLDKARDAPRRRTPAMHGYRTIADIMRALNPFEGELYREALADEPLTREMFCLMEGRHVHPSTLYPGGVGTCRPLQLFTDYLVRLMKYVEFMKRVVPLHDDLFDFFYEALPGYEQVGQRRVLLGCWGAFQDPGVLRLPLRDMSDWGRRDVRHARRRRRRRARHHRSRRHQPRHPDPARQLVLRRLGRSGDVRAARIRSATRSTGAHPWNQTRSRARRSATSTDKYTWVMSPRWFDGDRTTSRSTPAAARSRGSGRPRSRGSSTSAT